MLALCHRWCVWIIVLLFFLYRLQIQMLIQRPSLPLSTRTMQVWWGIFSFYTRFLFLHEFSLSPLFRIAETHASLYLVPLLSWIDCGDCNVVWFLHVCVSVPLWIFLCALYSLSIPILHSLRDPSPILSYLYSTSFVNQGFTIVW